LLKKEEKKYRKGVLFFVIFFLRANISLKVEEEKRFSNCFFSLKVS